MDFNTGEVAGFFGHLKLGQPRRCGRVGNHESVKLGFWTGDRETISINRQPRLAIRVVGVEACVDSLCPVTQTYLINNYKNVRFGVEDRTDNLSGVVIV